MTQPIQEPSHDRAMQSANWGVRQLFRRPAPPITGVVYKVKVFSDLQTVSAGDGKFILFIDEDADGMDLVSVEIGVTTVSSSGIVQVQIHNLTQTADMLSTLVQIDANEFHSKDGATQAVIDTANDDVAHGDRIRFDVDAAGTGAKGLEVKLVFEAP